MMHELLRKVQDVLTYIRAFLVVSRVEFMVMGIPVIALSALLAASSPDDLMGYNAVRLGLLAALWYLAYWICSQVNCIADYELDKRYKSRLPRAIDILKGPRTIWAIIAVEIVVASAIVVYLAISESRLGLVVLWVVGLFLVGAYSLEPLRFKRRGFLNLVTLVAHSVFLARTVHLLRDGATDEDTPPARPVGVQYANDRAATSQSDRGLPRGQGDERSDVDRSVGSQEGIHGVPLVHSCDERSLLIVFGMLARNPYAFVGIALMLVAYAATLRYHFKLFQAATSWEVTHEQAAAQRVRKLAAQVPLWFFVAGMPLVLVAGLNLI